MEGGGLDRPAARTGAFGHHSYSAQWEALRRCARRRGARSRTRPRSSEPAAGEGKRRSNIWTASTKRATLSICLRREPATSSFLKHQAEVSDAFGGKASAAYRRLAEAIENNGGQAADLELALDRGGKVSLRDGDAASAAWFNSNRARKSKIDSKQEAKQPDSLRIPGGFDALMFIARGPSGSSPERFLLDYCRTVLTREPEYDTAQDCDSIENR